MAPRVARGDAYLEIAEQLEAERARDAAEGERVAAGERQITDSRGLPVAPDAAAYGGAIYRTIAARRGGAVEDA